MTTHTYTPEEMSPLTDVSDIQRRIVVYGYTGISVMSRADADGAFSFVTVAEDDDKATVLANLKAVVVPTLSLDTYALEVDGDGVEVGTITVTDSRGSGGEGKTVIIHPPPTEIALTPLALVLNSSGQGTVTFGPSASSGVVSGKMVVLFSHAVSEGGATAQGGVSYV
jgi:hypothetical protein